MVRFNSAVSYLSDYYAGLMDELRTLIPKLGSNIRFEDDIWFCDKQKKSEGMPSSKFTLYFNVVPEMYRDMVKYFSLHVDSSLITIKGDISRINTFLKFLEQECGGVALKHVNTSHIKLYQGYLEITYAKLGTKSALYRSIYKFFRTMNNWPEFPAINPVKRKNPWTRTLQEQKNSNKLIPEHVAITLDQVFRDENLPLYFRVLYWIMRSIPSRVSEVTSMSLECLKPYGPNYALFIPTWKQNGSHMEPEIRVIHIKDEGHGEYLLNLIRQQQEASRKLQYLLL